MASHPVYVDIDLNGNQLQNARWENLSVAPSDPRAGQHYYDTVLNRPLHWNGTAWIDVQTLITSGNTPRVAFYDDQTGTSLNLPFPQSTLPAENERIRVYVQGFRLFPDRPGNPPRQLHWYREAGNLNDLIFHRPFQNEWVYIEII